MSSPSSVKIKIENDTESSENDVLLNFIETYEWLPILWNPTEPNYMNKAMRNAALDKLASIYVKIKPGATRVDVRRKINTLRCNYRKELRKIVASKRSGTGNVYQPTSWVFYALQFLDKFDLLANSGSQISDDETGCDEVQDLPSTTSSKATSRSSILSPPGARTQKKARVQNEHLQKVYSHLEIPQKNVPTIAIAWGEKLEILQPQQRAFAEKAINDVLFEASQGTLDRYSVRINENCPVYQISPSIASCEESRPYFVSSTEDSSEKTPTCIPTPLPSEAVTESAMITYCVRSALEATIES